MNYRDWCVGMKVVFVGIPADAEVFLHPYTEGSVYTVSDLRMVEAGDGLLTPDGEIVEAAREDLYVRVGFPGWALARCFRPVQPRKTDISIFTALLNPSRVEEPA